MVSHPSNHKRHLLTVSISLLLSAASARAAVTLDGTLGSAGPLTGPHYAIAQNVGQTRGNNLFHSFGQFSLTSAESATFSGSANINNVIARVTGGAASSIDGRISSTISGANLYLINPSGIVFGQNARLDVSGSFHASTADYLKFADNSRFDARTPANTVLSSASPSAFGFLGTAPAAITVNGALSVGEGQTLELVGGALTISGDQAQLTAPGGKVSLIAVGSPGEAPTFATLADLRAFDSLGEIFIGNNARVSATGAGSGTVLIRGGRLVVESALIESNNTGATDHTGAAIDIAVRGEFRLGVSAAADGTDSRIEASSLNDGQGGDIRITAQSVHIAGDASARPGAPVGLYARIVSGAYVASRGGDIAITAADAVVLSENATVSTESWAVSAEPWAMGAAGNITVRANSLLLDGTNGHGTQINSRGSIDISAADIVLRGDFGFNEHLSVSNSGDFSNSDSGSITLNAARLQVLDGARILAFHEGDGSGGNINITANDVLVSGDGSRGGISTYVSGTTGCGSACEAAPRVAGNLTIASGRLTLDRGGEISTVTDGSRGQEVSTIQINAQEVALSSGARIGATILGSTAGGLATNNILIDATRVTLSGADTGIYAQTGARGGGSGGIQIDSRELRVLGGARIDASAIGGVQGGSIGIRSDQVIVSGRDIETGQASTIVAEADQAAPGRVGGFRGRGGDIDITAREVAVSNYGQISVEANLSADAGNLRIEAQNISLNGGSIRAVATGIGNAGNIDLIASNALTLRGSTISTQAAQGDGGNITVQAKSLVYLNKSSIATSVRDGSGNGGNIFIDPAFVILYHSAIVANAFGGNGGNVTIVADNFIVSPDSRVTASSALGLPGVVDISAPVQNLNGGQEKLPESVVDATALFKSNCAATVGGRFSSFVVPGPVKALTGSGQQYSAYSGIGAPLSTERLAGMTPLPQQGCSL